MSTRENIARNLRALRKKKKITQEQLAEESGVSIAQIKRIELAQTNSTVKMLNKIAPVFGVHTTELIKD